MATPVPCREKSNHPENSDATPAIACVLWRGNHNRPATSAADMPHFKSE